jgi:hypothetical protein
MKTEIGLLAIALAIGGAVSYKELHKPNSGPVPVTSASPTAVQNNPPATSSTPTTTQTSAPVSTPTQTPALKKATPKKISTPALTGGVKPPSISGSGEHDGGREHEGGEGREGNDD